MVVVVVVVSVTLRKTRCSGFRLRQGHRRLKREMPEGCHRIQVTLDQGFL